MFPFPSAHSVNFNLKDVQLPKCVLCHHGIMHHQNAAVGDSSEMQRIQHISKDSLQGVVLQYITKFYTGPLTWTCFLWATEILVASQKGLFLKDLVCETIPFTHID